MPKYGYDDDAWEIAKAEGKAILARCARTADVIAYSDFITHVRAIVFANAHDFRLPYFLEEISVEENRAGRGMLTALVVHKHGDYKPGPGFFELAKKLGRDTKDIDKCWIEELKTIYAAWTNRTRS
jgi:hypothetical protein